MHTVELGVAPVRTLTFSSHQTEGDDCEGVVVAADPPEPFGEQHEESGCADPDRDLCQLGQRVLHLGDSRFEVARVSACTAAEKSARTGEHGEAERLGEIHELFAERQCSIGLAALDMVNRDVREHVREGERMVEALRQIHRFAAQGERPVVMAEVEIGSVRFCGLFGGTIIRDDGLAFIARRAPAPATCPVLGSTTPTSGSTRAAPI